MCFELDIAIHDDDGMLIDLEIDELYHRGQRQRAIDARSEGEHNTHVTRNEYL